ncbi:MAG: GMC oxidoreductase [Pseudomonadota bacterium]
MFVHLTSSFSPRKSYDVCIVGTGPAGMTLALKLRAAGLSVFLAEGGEMEYSDDSQENYLGKVVGDPYFDLDVARLRYFGGTSNHWGGMCRPLEDRDFEGKKVSPITEWPIRKQDLDPFLPEAREVLEISENPPDTPFDADGNLRRVHFVFSPPVRFAEKYEEQIANDSGLDTCLNCNATAIDYRDGRIASVHFENYLGHSIDVSAKAFVLACGGIENSRLLLHWNRKLNKILGGGDTVGRYWMEHPTQTVGGVVFCEGFQLPDDHVSTPYSRHRLYLAPSSDFIEKNNILNCRVRLDRLPGESCEAPSWIKSLLGLEPKRQVEMNWVRTSSEQEPVESNRVALGEEKDRFGIPRPVLHWRRSELDRKTFRSVALAIGKYFAGGQVGRLKLDDWVLSEELKFSCDGGGHCPGGYHHTGGTRMAHSSASGVVDPNCRVFGTKNLYVAGSSVFPSAGYCNPTMSIVQISLRLGDHLAAILTKTANLDGVRQPKRETAAATE